MEKHYTSERNIQIVIALMKAHGIRYVVASPGATNVTLVGSMQQDPFFKIYSSIDERSAGYIACGIAAETGEAVALSCTGATASRNYMPGLTEAFYRKLPILALTSTQHTGRVGNMIPQVIDRSVVANDIAKFSVTLPTIQTAEDEWDCTVKANRAILELFHNGAGPVHINLTTTYSSDFSVKELPPVRVIRRHGMLDDLPEIQGDRVGIFVGAHLKWSLELTEAVDRFCEKYNAAVFCDHTSNYNGKYKVFFSLACRQECGNPSAYYPNQLIHIGEISADYPMMQLGVKSRVWRVSPDGKICDLFKGLTDVFEMDETVFFKRYAEREIVDRETSYWQHCMEHKKDIDAQVPELPFSNPWIAAQIAEKLPENAVLHLGILNSIRSWNCFDVPGNVPSYANTGGFGIDGCMSSMVGASFVAPEKLFFGVFGDLAFFYDLNSLGNRHIGKNLRILLINNGRGTEFRIYNHPAARFGEEADIYMAAAGHYGKKSPDLIKHYSKDLGFHYLTASNKKEFLEVVPEFLNSQASDKSIIFEVFTDSRDENNAIKELSNIEKSLSGEAKNLLKSVLGEKGIAVTKKLLGK